MKNRYFPAIFCAICLAIPALALADNDKQRAPLIVSGASLSFGRFAALNGGTLTVSPAGLRTAFGVAPIGSAGISAANFTVISSSRQSYTLSLPYTATLVGAGGAHMLINRFTGSSPGGTCNHLACRLQPGTQQLFLGATLNVNARQATGGYSGSFALTVDYE